MGVVRPPGSSHGYSPSPGGPIFPTGFWPKFTLVATGVFLLGGTVLLSAFLFKILAAAAAGFTLGWLRRASILKDKFGESFVSALFGAGWGKYEAPGLVIDVVARTVVGYSVGVAFASSGAMDAGVALPVAVLGGSGAGGGPGGWIVTILLLLLIAMVVGAVAMLAVEMAIWAVMGAGTGITKDAASASVENVRPKPLASAIKGAATGVIIGIITLTFIRPFSAGA